MHIYLIAGEQSGDLLGARLMQELHSRSNHQFSGIGGEQMKAQGLSSLFPMSELALMGFVEILPHIPRLLKRVNETVADILAKKPDVIITIDSPGFCNRVVQACRKHFPKNSEHAPRFVHYVAPSVWAYKPGRAKKAARLFDHLLTLLPFEPPYFEKEGLPSTFVGHPLVESPPRGDGAAFRAQHDISPEQQVILAPAGSRAGELMRHIPLLKETLKHFPDAITLMPVVPHLKEMAEEMTADWPNRLIRVDQQDKWNSFAACNAALVKSGTVALELALANVPMVVYYKVNTVSAWLMHFMMLTKYVNLINIIEQRLIVPEFVQENATVEALRSELSLLLSDENSRKQQQSAFHHALTQLGLGREKTPSQIAADVVENLND